MKPCSRAGLELTWKCNWTCRHCFYLRNPNFHSGVELPLSEVFAKIDAAAEAGMSHIVWIGYGEPSLSENFIECVHRVRMKGMAVSVITNGTADLRVYRNAFALGLDHLHFSIHGVGKVLDGITCAKGAFKAQQKTKDWCAKTGRHFRSNLSMQQLNFEHMLPVVRNEASRGCKHFVFLGFLPHYEWNRHVCDVAVHPAELRPRIEEGVDACIEAGMLTTIRYQPFCHLAPKYWKYVTNANRVPFDPWEWNDELNVTDTDALLRYARWLGDSVACKEPCNRCVAREHCGGWNRTYANAFGGAGLQPIQEIPDEYADVWDQPCGVHDMNPANHYTGTMEIDFPTERKE